jgi:Uncharacterized protein conserved in bacteria (DUF2242)
MSRRQAHYNVPRRCLLFHLVSVMQIPRFRQSFRPLSGLSLVLSVLALAGCGGKAAPTPNYQAEMFSTGVSPFSRNYDATSQETCEASRRALLSQGYMTTTAQPDTIDATKNFQPSPDVHVVVSFHVVCTPGDNASNTSIAYVNAVQDGYTLKKTDTSASVGLSVLGSVSLPIRSNSDSLVKISSETVPAGKFYDQFFSLVGHYLQTVPRSSPIPGESVSSRALAPSLTLSAPELTSMPIVVHTPAASAVAQPALTAAPPVTPMPATASANSAPVTPMPATPSASSTPVTSMPATASANAAPVTSMPTTTSANAAPVTPMPATASTKSTPVAPTPATTSANTPPVTPMPATAPAAALPAASGTTTTTATTTSNQ